MEIYNIAVAATEHWVGRLLRRALLVFFVVAFAIAAIYHFTIAGTLLLEAQYGVLQARAIVAAVYAALALIAVAMLWATRSKPAIARKPALTEPRKLQLAMLVEAVMLGFARARKGNRAS